MICWFCGLLVMCAYFGSGFVFIFGILVTVT